MILTNTLEAYMHYVGRRLSMANLSENEEHQDVLKGIINQAARDIYDTYDLPNSLAEVTLQVEDDKLLSLPHYVGELRALKERYANTNPAFGYKWTLVDIRPRYALSDWTQGYKTWRVLNDTPLMLKLGGGSKLTFTLLGDECESVVISIVGPTATAAKHTEQLVIAAGDQTAHTTQATFTDCVSIRKNVLTKGDVQVQRSDDSIVSWIPNDQLMAKFKLVDVGEFPFVYAPPYTRYIDVLFKFPYAHMQKLTDGFISDGYEQAIIDKCISIDSENQEGKEKRAVGFNRKAEDRIERVTANKVGVTEKKISFAPSPLYSYFDCLGHN